MFNKKKVDELRAVEEAGEVKPSWKKSPIKDEEKLDVSKIAIGGLADGLAFDFSKPQTNVENLVKEVFKSGAEFTNAKIDIVNHPPHYEGKYECIEVMEATQGVEAVKSFCICNAFKYLWRRNNKNGLEDVKKAKWYIDKFIELEEREKDV